MSDRCELSDLPVDQCACRIHASAPPPQPWADIVARFPARFDSRCDYCGGPIIEGAWIWRTSEGDYVHADRCLP